MQLVVQNHFIVHQRILMLNYIEQHKGFIQTNEKKVKSLFVNFKKSLFGLYKQSEKNWTNLLHEFLTEQSFEQSLNEYCVYTNMTNNSTIIILASVDDLIAALD